MPFIETPESHRFPWYVRLFFWNQRRKYGAVLEPARLWGRTPRVFVALASLYGALDRRSSPIEPALRSLVTVRVSQINWCSFCVDINSSTVLKRGVDREKLAALAQFESSPLFSEREKAALAYAEAVTCSDRQPSAEHFARLRRHFDDDAIVELTALIAFQNLSSKFNAALGVETQGFCAAAPQPLRPQDPPDGRATHTSHSSAAPAVTSRRVPRYLARCMFCPKWVEEDSRAMCADNAARYPRFAGKLTMRLRPRTLGFVERFE